MFLTHLLTLKTIPLFLFTFVVFSNVSDPSIDFEDYSAISIHFCSLFWCFWPIYWLWRLIRYSYSLLYTFLMFLTHLLTLKTIPLFLFTFIYSSDVSHISIDFEDYSHVSLHFCIFSDVSHIFIDFGDHSSPCILFWCFFIYPWTFWSLFHFFYYTFLCHPFTSLQSLSLLGSVSDPEGLYCCITGSEKFTWLSKLSLPALKVSETSEKYTNMNGNSRISLQSQTLTLCQYWIDFKVNRWVRNIKKDYKSVLEFFKVKP